MKTVININGPEGNAFNLLGIAGHLATQLNLNSEEILSDMQSSNYDHLIEVFESNFGDYYHLER